MNTSQRIYQEIKVKKWWHLLTHPETGPFLYGPFNDLKQVIINEFRTKGTIAEDLSCVWSALPNYIWRRPQLWPDWLI